MNMRAKFNNGRIFMVYGLVLTSRHVFMLTFSNGSRICVCSVHNMLSTLSFPLEYCKIKKKTEKKWKTKREMSIYRENDVWRFKALRRVTGLKVNQICSDNVCSYCTWHCRFGWLFLLTQWNRKSKMKMIIKKKSAQVNTKWNKFLNAWCKCKRTCHLM